MYCGLLEVEENISEELGEVRILYYLSCFVIEIYFFVLIFVLLSILHSFDLCDVDFKVTKIEYLCHIILHLF